MSSNDQSTKPPHDPATPKSEPTNPPPKQGNDVDAIMPIPPIEYALPPTHDAAAKTERPTSPTPHSTRSKSLDAASFSSSYVANLVREYPPIPPTPSVPWNEVLYRHHQQQQQQHQQPLGGFDSGAVTPTDSIAFAPGGAAFVREEKWFASRRIKPGVQAKRPWLEKRDPKEKWLLSIPLLGIVIGLLVAGFLVWDGYHSVTNYKYCSVLDEDFSQGLRPEIWTREIELGGYGNGQFEQTTSSPENAYVHNGILHIKPTLQNASLVETHGTLLDLRTQGCTSPHHHDCVAMTNTTNGTIVPPVLSARLNTRHAASILFGRVEVEAKLPKGDWLWPAIWMLPRDEAYGAWPRSGEIDIAKARGNNYSYAQGGNNIVSSTLHLGPNRANDAWWRNNVKRKAAHTTFSDEFNTFGVEWTQDYIFTYINSRLIQILYHPLTTPFYDSSHFPLTTTNGTRLTNPWASARNQNQAPFDRAFYLVLNVGVGGTDGWFEDGKAGKPWVDASLTAKRDFWRARGEWEGGWKEGGEMLVRRVRMWQQAGFAGCREEDGVEVF
ncbi:unnamed protein product [Periconia digitata]|uniref:GH16 domain-containing protein n=1 Tax=Periconia digitata TaxID=1303443 RepID=A0A9W4XY71_9PLEO|nr:unnamed protein product [Periconia digitata]